ncbi:hypothetical protein CR513_48484, partial [Mucuna pruriens]
MHYLVRVIDRSSLSKYWISAHPRLDNDRVKKSLLNLLRREFQMLEMLEVETIINYVVRVMAVANKMWSNGEDMSDSKVVEKILQTFEMVNKHSRPKIVEEENRIAVEDVEKEDNPSQMPNCIAHMHILEAKQAKLDDKSFACILKKLLSI